MSSTCWLMCHGCSAQCSARLSLSLTVSVRFPQVNEIDIVGPNGAPVALMFPLHGVYEAKYLSHQVPTDRQPCASSLIAVALWRGVQR